MEFSAFVELSGTTYARFITQSGEPVLMTRPEVEARAANTGCGDAWSALDGWPHGVNAAEHSQVPPPTL